MLVFARLSFRKGSPIIKESYEIPDTTGEISLMFYVKVVQVQICSVGKNLTLSNIFFKRGRKEINKGDV